MMIADAAQRAAAIEVQQSFCVTAPAGSGKTELLIQRYLALLSRVQRPDQVLAITFTRKAAAEMRERVLKALADARQARPCPGEHEQVTRQLAEAALAHGAAAGWALERELSSLNIRTIDGFCSALTRQMPVLSRFGGQASAVDDAQPLYEEAVLELFALLDTARPEADDLRALLSHFDNNWQRLSELLVGMLGKRDQWHDYMGAQRTGAMAEARLRQLVTEAIDASLQSLAADLAPFSGELLALLQYAQGNLGETVAESLPAAEADRLPQWRRLRALLMTGSGDFRKRLTVKEGFPAGKGEAQTFKQRFVEMVAAFSQSTEIATGLQNLSALPVMDDHDDAWQLVVHLSHVLPLLSACLLVVFARRGSVDHIQVALSALDALGDDEAPTDLALRLDYSLEHILVDEFQDTAINQYRLVSCLTRGWSEHNAANPDAPRTVFIVGDGMQSIYGFRNANVGLFLAAREQGFNGVVPAQLALECNFRSDAGIVDWVNATFREAFPATDDAGQGRVRFSDAVAVRPEAPEPAVVQQAFYGEAAAAQEADWVVDQVRAALADPAQPVVAILGRSRPQLAPVVLRLRQAGIGFAAEEMDPLAASPAVIDLMTLARALANPADQVAWFALLRAPWCALTLADLHCLARAPESSAGLPAMLYAGTSPEALSSAGAAALERVAACLSWVEAHRDRLALRVWLEQAWQLLGGPECLPEPRFLRDAEQFFSLLERADETGVGLDSEWLARQVDRLYAAGDDPAARVQVMTLHKAKGLEFDRVIIPALARGTRGDDRALLLWDERVDRHGEPGFLLAADDHSDADEPTLYNYLKRQRRDKSLLENTRLLYVGATRAISRLYLSACLIPDGEPDPGAVPSFKPPQAGSLLHPIWPSFREQMQVAAPADRLEPKDARADPGLWRADGLPAAPTREPLTLSAANQPAPALNRVDRGVGTVIHELLEQHAALPTLPQAPTADALVRARVRLRELGLAGETLEAGLARIEEDLARTLADKRGGRWVLDQHDDARSEMALTTVRDDALQELVIDRCFVERSSGVRWIIDYKSSRPGPGEDLAEFTAREAQRYTEQLRGYRDALRALGPEPVRCALYFTGLSVLHILDELDA